MRLITISCVFLIISSCGLKEEKVVQKEDSIRQEYLLKGRQIAALTQSELLKNVSQAMQKGGPVYAIDFCNLKAMDLKDSLSKLNNCEIKRIAIKYRNPMDKPQTKTEKDQLEKYKQAFLKGDSLESEVLVFDDRTEYFQPIFMSKGACLVCHGEPSVQIAAETMEIIQERYPEDKATGFALNDFRGAWKITFMKE